MRKCKVCGSPEEYLKSGMCDSCYMEYSYDEDFDNEDDIEFDSVDYSDLDNLCLEELSLSDEVDRAIHSLDDVEESESFEYFISEAKEYRVLRKDIKSNSKHKADYDKLIEFYEKDILDGIYGICLANELSDDAVIVDASRGVVIYEIRRNRG